MRATDFNNLTWSAVGAQAQFSLSGGTYVANAISANWNGGNAQLQGLSGDGVTWVNLGSAFTANATASFVLPPGSYRWNITTTTAGTVTITRVPGE